MKSGSRLERVLRSGRFAVTAELNPPDSADPGAVYDRALVLAEVCDGINATDASGANVHMSSVGICALLTRAGYEPIMQVSCRDRNRIAIQGDLLGAAAMGVRNVLCLSGDGVQTGDQPGAIAGLVDGLESGLAKQTLNLEAASSGAVAVATIPRCMGTRCGVNVTFTDSTPEEISRFFEMLLCGGTYQDTRIFDQRTVARAVEPQVTGQVDRVLMMPIPLSMGFMLGLKSFGFYGPRTASAYGHLGFTNVLGWADPDRDISVAFMNTGKPLLSARMVTWLNVTRVIGTRIPRDRA